jgi:hypothetical protein
VANNGDSQVAIDTRKCVEAARVGYQDFQGRPEHQLMPAAGRMATLTGMLSGYEKVIAASLFGSTILGPPSLFD